MEEATTKINDIYINKYKTHDVINSLDESVCKTGDSINIRMHDVCKIALLDVFRNSMCTDKKRLLRWDSNSLYPAYESLVLPIILNICLNEDVLCGIVFQRMPKTYSGN
jgi:hypothetical protein